MRRLKYNNVSRYLRAYFLKYVMEPLINAPAGEEVRIRFYMAREKKWLKVEGCFKIEETSDSAEELEK